MPKEIIELSYSSGTMSKEPYSFRVLNTSPSPGHGSVSQQFTNIIEAENKSPIAVNAYPARIMMPFQCVFIDTYLSLSVFTRALNYAALEGALTLVAAQPLFLADVLTQILVQAGENALPKTLLMTLGGYPLPLSLETYMASLMERFSSVTFIMAYGVAEVDAGLLVSLGRDERGRHVFSPRSGEVRYAVGPDGRLKIGLGAEKPLFDTGDYAEVLGDSRLIISPNPKRYAEDTLRLLDTWDNDTWRRRTGFLVRSGDSQPRFQLRKGIAPLSKDEVEFWDFCRMTDFCWTKKPDWS